MRPLGNPRLRWNEQARSDVKKLGADLRWEKIERLESVFCSGEEENSLVFNGRRGEWVNTGGNTV